MKSEYQAAGGGGALKIFPVLYGNVSLAFCARLWPLTPKLTSCCEGPILEWRCRWRWPAGCCCGGGSIYPRWISAALCLPRWCCWRPREANRSTHISINGCIFTKEPCTLSRTARERIPCTTEHALKAGTAHVDASQRDRTPAARQEPYFSPFSSKSSMTGTAVRLQCPWRLF